MWKLMWIYVMCIGMHLHNAEWFANLANIYTIKCEKENVWNHLPQSGTSSI
jgi:hypothetical protein